MFRWSPPDHSPFFYIWELLTSTHDLYLYYDYFGMKRVFCLGCFYDGYLEYLPRACNPQNSLLHGLLQRGVVPSRRHRLDAVKFYLHFRTQLNICANPACQAEIHESWVFRQLLLPENKAALKLVEYDIKPIFLCCKCHEKRDEIKILEM